MRYEQGNRRAEARPRRDPFLAFHPGRHGRPPGKAAARREAFKSYLGFLKEFADKCHHGKEEGILFPALTAAGLPSQGGPVGVMLHEHVEGRALIQEMEKAVRASWMHLRSPRRPRATRSSCARTSPRRTRCSSRWRSACSPRQSLRDHEGRFEQHEETVIGHGRHEELHALLKDLKKKYLLDGRLPHRQ